MEKVRFFPEFKLGLWLLLLGQIAQGGCRYYSTGSFSCGGYVKPTHTKSASAISNFLKANEEDFLRVQGFSFIEEYNNNLVEFEVIQGRKVRRQLFVDHRGNILVKEWQRYPTGSRIWNGHGWETEYVYRQHKIPAKRRVVEDIVRLYSRTLRKFETEVLKEERNLRRKGKSSKLGQAKKNLEVVQRVLNNYLPEFNVLTVSTNFGKPINADAINGKDKNGKYSNPVRTPDGAIINHDMIVMAALNKMFNSISTRNEGIVDIRRFAKYGPKMQIDIKSLFKLGRVEQNLLVEANPYACKGELPAGWLIKQAMDGEVYSQLVGQPNDYYTFIEQLFGKQAYFKGQHGFDQDIFKPDTVNAFPMRNIVMLGNRRGNPHSPATSGTRTIGYVAGIQNGFYLESNDFADDRNGYVKAARDAEIRPPEYLTPDGKEILYTLRNGMMAGAAFAATGVNVFTVPAEFVKPRITSGLSCFDCHAGGGRGAESLEYHRRLNGRANPEAVQSFGQKYYTTTGKYAAVVKGVSSPYQKRLASLGALFVKEKTLKVGKDKKESLKVPEYVDPIKLVISQYTQDLSLADAAREAKMPVEQLMAALQKGRGGQRGAGLLRDGKIFREDWEVIYADIACNQQAYGNRAGYGQKTTQKAAKPEASKTH